MQILLLIYTSMTMIYMMWIAKYIYRERCFKSRKAQGIFFVVFFAVELVLSFFKGEVFEIIMVFFVFVAFSLMILVTRKRRRIRGMFLVLPIYGILFSVSMIPSIIVIVFTDMSINKMLDWTYFDLVGDLFVLVCILLFMRHVRKWRIKPEGIKINESEFVLSTWERRLLNSNGLVLLIICFIIIAIPDIQGLAIYEKYFIASSTVVIVMIVSSVIMMVVKSSSSNYYKALAKVNEHYLNAQLNHFRAYQQTQRETKRVRHDMKNHMLCISNLYDKGEFEKLGQYLHQFKDTVFGIDKELHIGNDVADAIINEKKVIAKSKGIEIHVEGSLAGITEIDAIDICTIFANALDNCLEALEKIQIPKPVIDISIRRNKNLVLISFTNAIGTEGLNCSKQLVTTKNDIENHGFGLENIRMTAEKYKGTSNFSIVDIDGVGKAFCLEVMIMLRND